MSRKKVGDNPEVFRQTPSGANPDTLKQLNLSPAFASPTGAEDEVVVNNMIKDPRTVMPHQATQEEVNEFGVGDPPEAYDTYASESQPAGGPQMGEDGKTDKELRGTAKVAALVDDLPEDAPDEHVVYGYGKHKITFGDLRHIHRQHKGSEQPEDE